MSEEERELSIYDTSKQGLAIGETFSTRIDTYGTGMNERQMVDEADRARIQIKPIDERQEQIERLQAENLMLRDRITELEAEVDELIQGLA